MSPRRCAKRNRQPVTQATLARFIHEGDLARYIRKMRKVYAERRQRLLNSLETDLAQWFRSWPSAAGLHLAGILNHGLSAKAVAESAARLGVKVEHFGQDSLALGYGAIESSLITEGIRRLRRAIKNVALTDFVT